MIINILYTNSRSFDIPLPFLIYLVYTFDEMKKEDFFTLIVKLFGLYSMIMVLFNVLPQLLQYIIPYGMDVTMMLIVITFSALTIGLFVLLLFYAPKVVKLLKLENGFKSDTFNFGDFSEDTIVKISSIVVGGITVIENLPSLIRYTLFAFSSGNTGQVMDTYDKFYWIASLVQIFVGLFLVFNYRYLARLLKNKSAQQ